MEIKSDHVVLTLFRQGYLKISIDRGWVQILSTWHGPSHVISSNTLCKKKSKMVYKFDDISIFFAKIDRKHCIPKNE